MIAFVSYMLKLPIQEVRSWTLKTISENFESQIFVREELKNVTEEME